MTRFHPRIVRIALLLGIATAPGWIVAQQRGGNNPFPGGTNPDGSLRPSAPVTRLFSQDAYTEYALLEPGSEQFRIKFLPENSRAGATEIENATRGGSEGSGHRGLRSAHGEARRVQVRRTRSGDPCHRREASHPGAARRDRPRAHLQDLQGSAHVHDERRRHRLGAQPERIPAGCPAAEGVLLHLVQRRRADEHDGRRPVEARVRQPERPVQPGDDPRAQNVGELYARAVPRTCSSTTSRRSTTSTRRRRDGSRSSRSTATIGRAAKAKLDMLAYMPLKDLTVIDLDTAKTLTPVKDGTVMSVHARRADRGRQTKRASEGDRYAHQRRLPPGRTASWFSNARSMGCGTPSCCRRAGTSRRSRNRAPSGCTRAARSCRSST